jgi:hypothetical protein
MPFVPYTAQADKCNTAGRLRAPVMNLSENITAVNEIRVSSEGDRREGFGWNLWNAG